MVDPSLSVEFRCARCEAVTMRVVMTAADGPLGSERARPAGEAGVNPGVAGVRTEAGGLELWTAVSEIAGGVEALRAAMLDGDADALLRLDREIVPFYCPQCGLSYCEAHWVTWPIFDPEYPAWFEELRGRCPEGHERLIHD